MVGPGDQHVGEGRRALQPGDRRAERRTGHHGGTERRQGEDGTTGGAQARGVRLAERAREGAEGGVGGQHEGRVRPGGATAAGGEPAQAEQHVLQLGRVDDRDELRPSHARAGGREVEGGEAAQGTRPGVQRHVGHRAQRGEDAGPAVVGDQPGQVDHHPLRPGRQGLGQRAPHPHRGGVRVDAGRLLVPVDVVVVDVAVGGAGVAHDGRRVAQRGQRERQVGPAGRDRHDGHLRARTGGDEGTTERGPRVG